MHKEILNREQKNLLPLVKLFKKDFGLVGGTAIALYIGHRESLDFDLFSLEEFDNGAIRRKIRKEKIIDKIIRDEIGQYTIEVGEIRFTFFHYQFPIKFSDNFESVIKIPSLLTLAAMKAYALGRRPKWKDYVDLYFIIKDFYSLEKICRKSYEIFKNEFSEKLFRRQLSYFDDINYQEKIIWMKGFEVSDEKIKKELEKFSVN
ncbi:MAG: nucleotidyl transferase AbiEii/AbiGii toxin family protein [Patescibacteria group bacterium]